MECADFERLMNPEDQPDDGEVARAMKILERRKKAAVDGGHAQAIPGGLTAGARNAYEMIASDFDLDWREVMAVAALIATATQSSIAAGAPLPSVVTGCYIDGIALGLILARERERGGSG